MPVLAVETEPEEVERLLADASTLVRRTDSGRLLRRGGATLLAAGLLVAATSGPTARWAPWRGFKSVSEHFRTALSVKQQVTGSVPAYGSTYATPFPQVQGDSSLSQDAAGFATSAGSSQAGFSQGAGGSQTASGSGQGAGSLQATSGFSQDAGGGQAAGSFSQGATAFGQDATGSAGGSTYAQGGGGAAYSQESRAGPDYAAGTGVSTLDAAAAGGQAGGFDYTQGTASTAGYGTGSSTASGISYSAAGGGTAYTSADTGAAGDTGGASDGTDSAASNRRDFYGKGDGVSSYLLPVPAPVAPSSKAKPSLYCYALTMSAGGELQLLKMQLNRRISLFACNEYAVFSNDTVSIGPDVAKGGEDLQTVDMGGGSMEVAHGGRWGTALNTDIFIRLWSAVFKAGRFRFHDWAVKLDADAVFLPQRLRMLLRPIQPKMTFLNNCKWGMHGPIEVVSHDAFGYWFNNMEQCRSIRDAAMKWQPVHWNSTMKRWLGKDKDHSFGEDQYLRRCFHTLHIRKVDEFRLLDELACGGDPAHKGCGNSITFHPFKEAGPYMKCFNHTVQQHGPR